MHCSQWIFDMDGTLTDSMTVVWEGAPDALLRRYGRTPRGDLRATHPPDSCPWLRRLPAPELCTEHCDPPLHPPPLIVSGFVQIIAYFQRNFFRFL